MTRVNFLIQLSCIIKKDDFPSPRLEGINFHKQAEEEEQEQEEDDEKLFLFSAENFTVIFCTWLARKTLHNTQTKLLLYYFAIIQKFMMNFSLFPFSIFLPFEMGF